MDCLEGMKMLPDGCVDLIIADPPYNISQKDSHLSDTRDGKRREISFDFGQWDYDFNPIPYLEECKRVLVEQGSIIIFTSEEMYGVYRYWFGKNMYPKQLFVWVKSNPLPQFAKVGYRNATELFFWAMKGRNTKDNPNFIFQSQEEMTNVFYEPIVGGKKRTEHPTQKPLNIFLHLVRTHCKEAGIVLDPFMGSGTTAVACKQLNRNFIGFEIEPKYVDIANKRLQQDVMHNWLEAKEKGGKVE